ncbi:hypothetical protein OG948_21540 [Embleya sp. NBC_00888]|uniref:hypothetical protein n=1 Tax=Embleya sp. NBC_00888 TaxID=2975960 RepID=UPI0038676475|nr:hypothetical protein OG948_21540 [Embleya sp. NBC_00888]
MTDIRDLRQTLARHDDLAPPPDGMVEQAYAGARRIRRRRLTVAGVGVAAVVAIGAITPAVVSPFRDDRPEHATAPTPPVPKPAPLSNAPALTLDVDRANGFYPLQQGFAGPRALASIRSHNTAVTGWGGNIAAYPAADVDMAAIEAGTPIRVQGKPARYVPDYLLSRAEDEEIAVKRQDIPTIGPGKAVLPTPHDVRSPVIAWPDASGRWVIVSGAQNRAELDLLAEAVRVVPTGVTAPYRIGFVPPGLRFDYGGSATSMPSEANSVLVFVDAGRPAMKRTDLLGLTERGSLRMQLTASDNGHLGRVRQSGPPTVLGSRDTWYFTAPAVGYSPTPGGALMVVDVGGHELLILVESNTLVPYPALARMVESLDFKNVADPGTWVAPLP